MKRSVIRRGDKRVYPMAYVIREIVNGKFRLEQNNVSLSEPFDSLEDAKAAMNRCIKPREWHFDAQGREIRGSRASHPDDIPFVDR